MHFLLIVSVLLHLAQPGAYAAEASAHRGDLKSAPENTLPAFVSAVRKGAGQIELDVQFSKDRKLVIMHDISVDRTTDGTGNVEDMTFEELRRLDAGKWFDPSFEETRIPTIKEALGVIPVEVLCNIHVKGDVDLVVSVAKRLSELGRLDNCFITISTQFGALGNPETYNAFSAARAAVGDIKLCMTADETIEDETGFIPSDILARYMKKSPGRKMNARIDYIQLRNSGKTVLYDQIAESVKKLHQSGILVSFCFGDDVASIRKLLKTSVDYILTNDLDLCVRVLTGYEMNSAEWPGVNDK